MVRFLILFIYLFCSTVLIAQDNQISSGFAHIIIKSDKKIYPAVLSVNPIRDIKAEKCLQVDDSTYLFSIFTIGPTTVRLTLEDIVYPFIVYPNQSFTLSQKKANGSDRWEAKGVDSEVFDEATKIFELTGEGFDLYFQKSSLLPGSKSANSYKLNRLLLIDSISQKLTSELSSSKAQLFFSNSFKMFMSEPLLEYEKYMVNELRDQGLDSLNAIREMPTRDLSYYENLITSDLMKSKSLISANYYSFLRALRNDSLLDLDDISETSLDRYKKRLSQVFPNIINDDSALFYDLMIAGAYMDQINQNRKLTEKQRLDVIRNFKNPDIVNYIFHENSQIADTIAAKGEDSEDIPEINGAKLLKEIIGRHAGKIILIDFWATWCGPCIENFPRIQELKAKLENKIDLELVNITDATSNPKLWKDFVAAFEADHYYIRKDQMNDIYKHFKFSSLPTYFIVDKKGEIVKIISGLQTLDGLQEYMESI